MKNALSRGLINMSSLARELQPRISLDLRKDVSVAAILMAIKRTADRLEVEDDSVDERLESLSLRADLTQYTVLNSDRLESVFSEVIRRIHNRMQMALIVTRSTSETSIVASQDVVAELDRWLANETVTSRVENLCAISLRRIRGAGSSALHLPLLALAQRRIPVLNISSTNSEQILLVSDDDVDNAVSAIRQTLRESQRGVNA